MFIFIWFVFNVKKCNDFQISKIHHQNSSYIFLSCTVIVRFPWFVDHFIHGQICTLIIKKFTLLLYGHSTPCFQNLQVLNYTKTTSVLKLLRPKFLESLKSTEHFLNVALVDGMEMHILVEAFDRLFEVCSTLLILEIVTLLTDYDWGHSTKQIWSYCVSIYCLNINGLFIGWLLL